MLRYPFKHPVLLAIQLAKPTSRTPGWNTDIDIMIYLLLEAQQLKTEEVHRQQLGRQQEVMKRTMQTDSTKL